MILITGASGHVGRRVAELLAEQGQELRLLARNPQRAPSLGGAQVAQGDYTDVASLGAAFAGVDTALIVSIEGREGERAKLHKNAMDAAARAGVRHIVYLSFQGAAPTSKFPMARDHSLSEGYLRDSGVPFTALRDNLYLDMVPELFNEAGVMRGPAGQGRCAWVSREDVAQVAATILANPPSNSATYDVTGPEALTMAETAARLSTLVGRELRYQDETLEEGRAWRSQYGVPHWEVDTWLGSYLATAAGELETLSDTVQRITGRPPFDLETYFEAHPELLAHLRA